MQENEFEKQLKNMMGEFKLTPSASVWEKVSRRLKEDRRKKRPFIFLLFMSLLIAGYFMYRYAEQQTQPINYTGNKTDNSLKKDSLSLKDPGQLFIEKNADQNKPVTSVNKNKYTADKKLLSKANSSGAFIAKSNIYKKQVSVNNVALSNYDNENSVQQLNVNPVNNAGNASPALDKQLQNNNPINQPEIINDSARSINDTAGNYASNKNLVQTDSIQIKQNKKDSVLQQTVTKTGNKNYTIPKWQWGVTAFYGRSNTTETPGNFDKSAPSSLNNPGTATGNYDTAHYNSNPYTASNAYHFGFVVQRKIIKNGFIAAGLNFIHLSTKADVSGKIDSAYTVQTGNSISSAFYVNTFYQRGASSTYTNTYNFIELPVYFQQDVLYKHKLSFSYNAGFSVRQLISSNALIYNQYGNIYYSKDDLLHKTQLQFSAGINLKINTGKNTALYIGPQFSYSLSNLLKDNNSGNFHLINYGLQAGLMFHKK